MTPLGAMLTRVFFFFDSPLLSRILLVRFVPHKNFRLAFVYIFVVGVSFSRVLVVLPFLFNFTLFCFVFGIEIKGCFIVTLRRNGGMCLLGFGGAVAVPEPVRRSPAFDKPGIYTFLWMNDFTWSGQSTTNATGSQSASAYI